MFCLFLNKISSDDAISYRNPSNKHWRLARWRKWRACDVGEAKEGSENKLWRRWSNGRVDSLILQAFSHFTYVTDHSPTLPSLYLRHSSFSNPSVASSTSQLVLQPFFCFSYVTGFSLTSPWEPHMTETCFIKFSLRKRRNKTKKCKFVVRLEFVGVLSKIVVDDYN